MLEDPREKEVIWVSTSEIVFGGRSLALDGEELGIENSGPIQAKEILESLPVIPWIYHYPIYKPALEFFREKLPANVEFVEFAYDWREDNAKNAKHLAAKVHELEGKGRKHISIMSHSMGGLILAYYLRYGDQDPEHAEENWAGAKRIERATFAGAPFHGSIAMLHDFMRGNPAAGNTELLSRDSLSSFYSTYQLLPPAEDRPLLDVQGNQRELNYLDPEVWDRWNRGMLNEFLSPDLRFRRKQATAARLERALLFSQKISAPTRHRLEEGQPRTRLLFIFGEGRKTAARALFCDAGKTDLLFSSDEPKDFPKGFPLDKIFLDGDGIVPRYSSVPPEAYLENFDTEQKTCLVEHGDFYADEELQQLLLKFLESPLRPQAASASLTGGPKS